MKKIVSAIDNAKLFKKKQRAKYLGIDYNKVYELNKRTGFPARRDDKRIFIPYLEHFRRLGRNSFMVLVNQFFQRGVKYVTK